MTDPAIGPNAAKTGFRRLVPASTVIVAYLIVVAILTLIFNNRVTLWGLICFLHVCVIVGIFLLARARSRINASRFVLIMNDWYPVVLIPLTYKELEYLIPRIHPHDYDKALAAIDHNLFGVNPTVWLERFAHPALTELLQLAYPSYYFLPVVLGLLLWRARRYQAFDFFVFILAVGFYLSYLGYIIVPAVGPRFLLADLQTKPLSGLLFFSAIRRALDNAEGITRDCFPSGHTELTMLVLYYARRFRLKTFWIMLPIGIAIIVATVYLRYHYVIDVAAGALLALGVIALAKPMYRWLGGRFEFVADGTEL